MSSGTQAAELPYAATAPSQSSSVEKEKAVDEESTASVVIAEESRLQKALFLFAAFLTFVAGNSFQVCIGSWIAGYVKEYPSYSYAELSLIAGVNVAVADVFCGPSGALIEAFGTRWHIVFGSFCMVLSFITLAQATEIWQIYICQGVIQGIGVAALVLPAIILAQQHFPRHTGLVVTSIASGVNAGALIFTVVYNELGKSVNSAWRNRIIGFILIPMLAFVFVFLRPPKHLRRVQSSKKKIRVGDWVPKISCLKDPALRYLAISKCLGFFSAWGYTVWAETLFDQVADSSVRDYLWVISQSCSIVSRILIGWYSDGGGVLDTTIAVTAFCAIVGWVTWLPIDDTKTALAFVILFGLASGAMSSLPDAAILKVAKPEQRGSALGLSILACTPAPLAGPAGPALGALLIQDGARRPFLRPGILWGSSLVAATAFAALGRHKHTSDWKKRI